MTCPFTPPCTAQLVRSGRYCDTACRTATGTGNRLCSKLQRLTTSCHPSPSVAARMRLRVYSVIPSRRYPHPRNARVSSPSPLNSVRILLPPYVETNALRLRLGSGQLPSMRRKDNCRQCLEGGPRSIPTDHHQLLSAQPDIAESSNESTSTVHVKIYRDKHPTHFNYGGGSTAL